MQRSPPARTVAVVLAPGVGAELVTHRLDTLRRHAGRCRLRCPPDRAHQARPAYVQLSAMAPTWPTERECGEFDRFGRASRRQQQPTVSVEIASDADATEPLQSLACESRGAPARPHADRTSRLAADSRGRYRSDDNLGVPALVSQRRRDVVLAKGDAVRHRSCRGGRLAATFTDSGAGAGVEHQRSRSRSMRRSRWQRRVAPALTIFAGSGPEELRERRCSKPS